MKTLKVLFFVIFIASIYFNGICTQGTIGKVKSKTPLKKTGSFSSSKGNDKKDSDGSVYDNYQRSKNGRTPFKKSESFSSLPSQTDSVIDNRSDKKRTASFAFNSDKDERKR